MHFYLYSPIPIVDKISDVNNPDLVVKLDNNELPKIEIKSKPRLMYCAPSCNATDKPRLIIGTSEPRTLPSADAANALLDHFNNICKKYGLPYLDNVANGRSLTPIEDLFRPTTKIPAGHNRHEAILRVMESLISRNINILSLEEIKEFARTRNNELCDPPLHDKDFEFQWKCATEFIAKNVEQEARRQEWDVNQAEINRETNVKEAERNQSTINREDDHKADKTYNDWNEKLLESYENLHTVTLDNIPDMWGPLEFALSVKSILNIEGCTIPFAGIILGPPGSLKTTTIQSFRGCEDVFYTDSFTAKSLVSHNSAVKKDKLKEIDMLPKIKDKFFLTPELAPIFSARDEELLEILGILTRVLDGHGTTPSKPFVISQKRNKRDKPKFDTVNSELDDETKNDLRSMWYRI